MFSKQSVFVLFVGIFASAIAADLEEYDIDSLRNMLRSQSECPTGYSNYMQNCTQKYQIDIAKCDSDEKAAKLSLKEGSLKQRTYLMQNTESTCTGVHECDKFDDVSEIFGCYANLFAEGAPKMNNMAYEANEMQSDYNKKIQNIDNTKSTCTNTTTWALSTRTAAAIDYLSDCFRKGGKWELLLLVNTPEPTPTTEAPVVTKTPVAPVTPEIPESFERSSENSEEIAADLHEKEAHN